MSPPRTSTAFRAALFAALCGVALTAAAAARGTSDETALAELSWLAGHWRSDGEAFTEELWTEPAGGLMLAVNRELLPGRRAAFEYLRIEAGPDGLVYVASPGGRAPTPFPLARSGERHVAFENPEHDWPQVIEYRIDDEGVLQVRAAGLEAGSREYTLALRRVD